MTAPVAPTAPAAPAVGPLDQLAKLAAGNQNLITHPGLLAALQQGNATYQQASAINSFMSALDVQKQVRLARQAGAKLNLSNDQQVLLKAVGENFSDVAYTHADAVADEKTAIAKQGLVPVYDKAGNIVGSEAPKPQASGGGDSGWFGSVGGFFHHVTHNPVTRGINRGWNVVDSTVTKTASDIWTDLQSIGSVPTDNNGGETTGAGGKTAAESAAAIQDVTQQNAELMTQLGFDPKNPLSVAAFTADGYAHLDTSDLASKWDKANPGLFGWTGDQAVLEAEKFAINPDKYIQDVADDPTLTPDQKTARLGSVQLADLARQVGSRQSSIGNLVALGVGLDPVKHPTAYAWTSGVADAAASFVLDPTVAALGAVKAARVASIGLDGAADGEKIRTILDPANSSLNAGRVQQGWQSLMADAKTIREADLDTLEGQRSAATAYAHARASTPGIVDMLPDLNGQRLDVISNTITKSAPIETWGDLTNYLASKAHFLQLTRGKTAAEAFIMPGSMSRFGYRTIKGALAGKIAGRSTAINLSREANVDRLALPRPDELVDDVTGNPAVQAATDRVVTAEQSFSALNARHAAATAAGAEPTKLDDIATSRALAGSEADAAHDALASAKADARKELASQSRATVSAADKGEMLRLARTGVGPMAQWARLKLSGQRLSSFLPRNNVVRIGDADSAEKVYRFGLTYLTKGDAALYGAMWAKGDEGVQKAIIDGIVAQVGHAAGLGTTDTGRALLATLPELNLQRYGHIGNESIVDPVTGTSRDVALFPQQVRQEFYLPSFQSLHQAAAKFGIWDKTVGRAMNFAAVDQAMNFLRAGMLLKPNTAYRNIIEGQGNIAVRGRYLDLLRAKAAANAGGVLTPRKALLQKAISLTALDRVGRLSRGALLRTTDPEWLKGVKEFTEGPFAEEFQPTVMGFGQQIVGHAADPFGVEDVGLITRSGFLPVKYKRTGFDIADAGGVLGAERFQHALATRVGQFPDLDKALLAAVENPGDDLSGVVDLLNSKAIRPTIDRMIRSHQLTDENGIPRRVATAADRDIAMRQMAGLQVADLKYLLSNSEGEFNKPLSDYIFEHGAAPSAGWIQKNLTDVARPKGVLAPTYAPMAANGKLGFVSSLLDSTGALYKKLVEDPIKRTTTEPAFLMNYGDARMALRGVQKDMVSGGLSEETAQRAIHDIAVKRAYNATEDMIDDPGLKTQADVVGRNFLMFSRAVQAFARRWGGLAVQNPLALRRGFLAVEALHHTGLVYTDPNGNVNFTYPGSDFAMQAMTKLSSIVPGLGAAVTYPISGALGGQFNMVAPGFDNPARFSLSPMLNVPFHLLENLSGMKDHRELFDEVDRALNGSNAQGKSWYSELVPGAVGKFTAATSTDRDSAFASSMTDAIKYLYAADPDGTKGIFPGPGASAAQIDTFLGHLKVQVRNQLFLRAAFGEFAPAPPGLPTEQLTGKAASAVKVDALFSAAGVKNLDDEYKILLNDVGGDRATAQAIFTEKYPSRFVFSVAGSKSTSGASYLPSTAKAESWINNNMSFIGDYKKVAAYFIPQDDGAFDLNAYHAQLEVGLRQKSTPLEFLQAVRVQQAETDFYAALDTRKAAYGAALAAGNKAGATLINRRFDGWEQQFLAANPLFAKKQADQAAAQVDARGAIDDLTRLLADPHAPGSVKTLAPQLNMMINSYNVHQQWVQSHSTSGYVDYTARSNELQRYEAYMTQLVATNPNLQAVYNGIFKPLNYTPTNSYGA